MIPVRKALRLCKVSFKMLFIRADGVRREQCRSSSTPSDAGSPERCHIEQECNPCTACHADLGHSRDSPLLGHSHTYRIFLQGDNSVIAIVKTGMMFTWELPAALLDKGKATQVVPRGSCPRAPLLQRVCPATEGFVQHSPILWATLGTSPAARHSLRQLRLAAVWVAGSSRHRILLLCQSGLLCTSYLPSPEGSLETDSGSVIIASKVSNMKHMP